MQVNFTKKCTQSIVAFSLGFAALVTPHVASAACGDPVEVTGTVTLDSAPEGAPRAATLTVPDCGVGKVVYKGPGSDSELVGDLYLNFKSEPSLIDAKLVMVFKDPSGDAAKPLLVLTGGTAFVENHQNFLGGVFFVDQSTVVTSSDITKLFDLMDGDKEPESMAGFFSLKADVLAPMFKVPSSAPANQ